MAGASPPFVVLIHLAWPALWDELRAALRRLPGPHRLAVNLVAELHDASSIERQREQVLRHDPDATVLVSPNRGLDVGGMLRLFDAVRGAVAAGAERPVGCLYLHSKTDPGWRRGMLAPLVGHAATALRRLGRPGSVAGSRPVGMIGAGLYPFDYYNVIPALELLDRLGVAVRTDWTRYHEAYPETGGWSLERLLEDARSRPGAAALRPEIDLLYYRERLGGRPGSGAQPVDRRALRTMIDDGVLGPLPYFPGNCFWIALEVIDALGAAVDLVQEADALPAHVTDDVRVQSPAHAWERVLPIFALKRGYSLVALG